ncbi:MAG: prephenate dehydratase [Ignavibacteriales bacterium]|nr:prephenate dehydratase [Ignavibacteriales bacterium]
MRQTSKKAIISYQGEPGAFSEQAGLAYFGKKCTLRARETFDEVFNDVVRKRSRYAIIPIENSLFGSVHQNYDLLQKEPVFIVGEIKLRIRMNLLAMPGVRLRDIRHVYSHPQGLGQCHDFIRSLPNCTPHPFYDTAGAAKMIQEEQRRDAAAIASSQAAAHYGLSILRKSIESDHRNFTRFIILATQPARPARNPKTSIIFATKNIPGALYKSLSVFALRNINMLKIESRPIVGRPWEYLFFVDIKTDNRTPECRNALAHLQELASYSKNLGSYESGRSVLNP